ncbi:MAG: hypothetical protein AMK73_06440 [Planctomycetes bacterium SM23_32]|nr:MAG: hypothetical protein AMK73_06440 [Planctomycetes bacterium SM23_32]
MKAMPARLMLLAACLLAAVRVVALAEDEGPAPQQAEAPDVVRMAEVVLDGTTARGKILHEDDEMIRIESVDGSTIGYRKDRITGLRRYAVSPASFHEQRGDYRHERAADAPDALAELTKARQAYQRALVLAESEADRARIQAKLQTLEAEGKERHEEAVRQEALAKAREETELARLAKQLTQEKLAALEQQGQDIVQLTRHLNDLEQKVRLLGATVERLERRIEELDDDLDRLDRLDRVFITNTVFLNLQRDHERLKRDVDRLEREMRRP